MPEYAFEKKPRRMTDPPQNNCETFVGYGGVQVKLETDPARVAYFTREATWGDIMHEPTQEEMQDTLREVASGRVLGAAKEVPALGFRVVASRTTMDQLLRLREAAAGAQTTRDNDQRDFNIVIPNTVHNLQGIGRAGDFSLLDKVEDLVCRMRDIYGELVDAGIPPQDARYVALPLGFSTQWMHVMNLRALEKMCEQRLCNGLTQHESNYVVRLMRDRTVERFPWFDKGLRSSCEKRGCCASATMLFPPCGAFQDTQGDFTHYDLDITQHNPEKHLYPASANDAMQFAEWDQKRKALEEDHPEYIFCMAGPPKIIAMSADATQ